MEDSQSDQSSKTKSGCIGRYVVLFVVFSLTLVLACDNGGSDDIQPEDPEEWLKDTPFEGTFNARGVRYQDDYLANCLSQEHNLGNNSVDNLEETWRYLRNTSNIDGWKSIRANYLQLCMIWGYEPPPLPADYKPLK